MDIRNPTVGRAALDLWFDRIRPECRSLIRELERTGKRLTMADLKDMRGNSWEWAALRGFLADDALAWFLEHSAVNAGVAHRSPPVVYDDTLANVFAPLAAARLLELASVNASGNAAIVRLVTSALMDAGFGHETDQGSHPPRLTEIPRCVRDLADAADRARRVAEDQEATLYGLRAFILDNWKATPFWGVGKKAPEGWTARKIPLAYSTKVHSAANGKDAGPTLSLRLMWVDDEDGWKLSIDTGNHLVQRSNNSAPWHDPPFDWVDSEVEAFRGTRG